MVSRPVVSSMRSRHTGQVGNSTRDGVGGGNGFNAKLAPTPGSVCVFALGVKGSRFVSGNEDEVDPDGV